MLDMIIPAICPGLIFIFIGAVWVHQWRTAKKEVAAASHPSPVGKDWKKHVDSLAFHGFEGAAVRLYQSATLALEPSAVAYVSDRKAAQGSRQPYLIDRMEYFPLVTALLSVDMQHEAVEVYRVCHPEKRLHEGVKAVQAILMLSKVGGLRHSAEIAARHQIHVEVQELLDDNRLEDAINTYRTQMRVSRKTAEAAIRRLDD